MLSTDDDGIVVVRSEGKYAMDVQNVPPALQERLGPEGTLGLVAFIHAAGREWKADTVNSATERFERRLVEEVSSVRVQMAQMETRLTDRMSGLLKWSFLFWIGQVLAMTAIMSAMLGAA